MKSFESFNNSPEDEMLQAENQGEVTETETLSESLPPLPELPIPTPEQKAQYEARHGQFMGKTTIEIGLYGVSIYAIGLLKITATNNHWPHLELVDAIYQTAGPMVTGWLIHRLKKLVFSHAKDIANNYRLNNSLKA